ncbi:protein kinase [Actinomadura luteofluorescens]|uniref:protein kinase domain-containing protein n=1 Tax=Actinomadura luteofluorescens TaxID=46163 RepID=UPI00362D1A2F
MATVYLARDLRLDRIIAIKVMHAGLASDEDFVARFIGEAKAAAALSHPNVVAVYDQRTDGEHVFLVMEYVAGRTLRDALNSLGRLGPAPRWRSCSRCWPRSAPRTGPVSCTATSSPRTC